jgi:hypothetical protein
MMRYLRGGDGSESRAEVLAAHGVALLLSACREHELTSAEQASLRAAADPYLLSSLQAEQLAVTVSDVMATAEIRHVVYKGPALAARWRHAVGSDVRTFTDLDVLIEPNDRERADRALIASGLLRGPVVAGEASYNTPEGAVLDLHWLPLNDTDVAARFRLDTTALFASHVTWEGMVGHFSPTMTLLHTAGHAIISDLAKLSAAVDIHATATDPDLDWDDVVTVAGAHSMGLVLSTALTRTKPWLDTPVPPGVLRRLDADAAWRKLAVRVARRDPADYLGGRWSGGEFYRHTRESTAKSVASLARSIGANVKVQRQLLAQKRARSR